MNLHRSFLVSSALALGIMLALGASYTHALAQEDASAAEDANQHVVFRVEVTNLTKGQAFSPIVVASHRPGVRLFELGAPAPPPLVRLAENGNPAPLAAWLSQQEGVIDVAVTEGLLEPGASVVVPLRGAGPPARMSAAGMLLPTNDGFFALNGARVPARRDRVTHFSPAFDAGSERNDEQCTSIPGPPCEGNGGLDGEGFVHVHGGIHGVGDLVPALRDWRNPVARVRIQRIVLADEAATEP